MRDQFLAAIEHAVGSYFQGRLEDLVFWVADEFASCDEQWPGEFLMLLRLADPIRKEVEAELVAFLRTIPELPKSELSLQQQISRQVDWGETYARSLLPKPAEYWERRVIDLPDLRLLGGLRTLAEEWLQQLRDYRSWFSKVEKFTPRIDDLEKAILNLPRTVPTDIPFDYHLSAALRALPEGQRLAQLLDQERNYANQSYQSQRHQPVFSKMLETALQRQGFETKNSSDKVLEVIATVALVKSAEKAGWQPFSEWTQGRLTKQKKFRLRKDGVELQIFKGPIEVNKKKQDRSLSLRQRLFGSALGAKEPDIILHFFCIKNPKKKIFLLGDAKRNETTQSQYYSTSFWSLINNILAYRHLMKVQFDEQTDDFLSSTVNVKPCGLLFFHSYQAPNVQPESLPIQCFSFEKDDFNFNAGRNTKLDESFQNIQAHVFNTLLNNAGQQ